MMLEADDLGCSQNAAWVYNTHNQTDMHTETHPAQHQCVILVTTAVTQDSLTLLSAYAHSVYTA